MKAHLYGVSPYLPDAPFLTAEELHNHSGGNTGNLMFCHALARIFEASPIGIAWGANLENLCSESDCLILPLANQLGPHVDLGELAKRFSTIEIPMVGIGLGVQGPIEGVDPDSIPEGSWQWLRTLVERAPFNKPNLAVRGEETLKTLGARGFAEHCIVTGCPSNFINPSPVLGREIYRRRANGLKRVVVAAGNPFLPEFRRLEQSLTRIVEQSDGLYVCQHPIEMLRLAVGNLSQISRADVLVYRDYIQSELSIDDLRNWFIRYAHIFTSVPEWIATMQRFDLVIGTRIHGVMAGIQAGVPSLCLCIDSRTLELCKSMKIPYLDANELHSGICMDQIETALSNWDWKLYDATRYELVKRFSEFANWNGLEARAGVKEILKNSDRSGLLNAENLENVSAHQLSTAPYQNCHSSIFKALNYALNNPCPKILSFGCSDGYEPNDLATKYFDHGHIIGCDIDQEALRIAEMHNRFPSRVHFVSSDLEILRKIGPFDAVIAMSVLCRWPEASKLDDLSQLYPFEKFSTLIADFYSLLRPGGILCVYDANYSVMHTSLASHFEIVDFPDLLPQTQQVKIFNKTGEVSENQNVKAILFRRRDLAFGDSFVSG